MMASKGHITGMRGVYLVAAELAKLGFIVSPTSRSAAGADLLVTDQECKRAYSVQVKTNRKVATFWLAGKRAREISSKTHIYVFVNLRKGDAQPDFYVIPSKIVARKTTKGQARTKSIWYIFWREDAEKYQNKWSIFGPPM